MVTWQTVLFLMSINLVFWVVGIALGYTRGTINGRLEIARTILAPIKKEK